MILVAARTFAQDKQFDYKLSSGGMVYAMEKCGDDEFFVVYGKMLLSKNASKNLMKFDKDLKAEWTNPITFSGTTIVNIYSYTDPVTKVTTGYIYGGEQFIQVLSDGTSKEKKTLIPEKELENVAAIFTNARGLNIICLTGEKDDPTAKMNWYVFSHSSLTKKVMNITLPSPTGADKSDLKNGWLLNTVSSTGLYFEFVSYKKDVKSTDKSILECNVVKVDSTGKTGDIVTLDLERDKYNIIPATYTPMVENITIVKPELYSAYSTTHSAGNSSVSFVPLHNTYMGLIIDEKNKSIYTVVSSNDDLKVSNDGTPKNQSLGRAYPIKNLSVIVYDLTGKKINESTFANTPTALESHDDCSYHANDIDLCLLPGKEGLICKVVNNANGNIFELNTDGSVDKQNKISLFAYTYFTAHHSRDTYSQVYTSKNDYETSPYYNGDSAPECIYFNKLDKKTKEYYCRFITMKSGNVFAYVDDKENVLKLNYFIKK